MCGSPGSIPPFSMPGTYPIPSVNFAGFGLGRGSYGSFNFRSYIVRPIPRYAAPQSDEIRFTLINAALGFGGHQKFAGVYGSIGLAMGQNPSAYCSIDPSMFGFQTWNFMRSSSAGASPSTMRIGRSLLSLLPLAFPGATSFSHLPDTSSTPQTYYTSLPYSLNIILAVLFKLVEVSGRGCGDMVRHYSNH
jgi:hypothetical protein